MGVNPPNPQKRLMSNTHSTHSKSAESWHTTHPQLHGSQSQGHWVVAHRLTARRGWLVDNRTQEWVSERLANIHPRAAKKPLWNIAKSYRPQSVGRSLIGRAS